MSLPPAPPTVVVFDLGGVLIDWSPRHLFDKVFNDAARLDWFLANVCNGAFFRQLDVASDSRVAMVDLQARHPEHAAEIGIYIDRFDETVRGEFPSMARLVERLHAAGTRLYGLTNWAADTFARTRPRLPSLALLRDIIVSGEERLIKPDPRLYDVLFRRGGFAPSDAVFVDDNQVNADAAAALGMRAIHHHDPDSTIKALRAMGLPA
ncbi:MAG TPA: HAD family phosphatase [Vineibacter sp.]|nr:HAD family phosphatase [Vineibacter sp.]